MKWEHARLLKFSFAIQEWPAIKTNGSRNRKQNKKKLKKNKGKHAGARRNLLKCDRLVSSYIRILHWNCASMSQQRPVIKPLVNRADIVALQETNLGGGTV